MSEPVMVVQPTSLREAFGLELVNLAREGKEFYVLDADVAGGTGTHHFRKAYPDRFIQCNISEQSMMAYAAGINIATNKPVFVTGFATFLMRGWEIARLSIDYPNRNVKIIASHGGIDAGPDGHSAQGVEDLACWRTLCNFAVISPSSVAQLKKALPVILDHNGPVYMRTGRSSWESMKFNEEFNIGKSYILQQGTDVTLIATGKMTWYALRAGVLLSIVHGISTRVVDMPTISPIDHQTILNCCNETKLLVTIEDHCIRGGLYGAVSESVVSLRNVRPILAIGVDGHGMSGDPNDLLNCYYMSVNDIVKEVRWEWEHR